MGTVAELLPAITQAGAGPLLGPTAAQWAAASTGWTLSKSSTGSITLTAPASGASWGSITGTILNQADLVANFAQLSGATFTGPINFGGTTINQGSAANIIAFRDGTTATELQLTGTYTDSTHYERLVMRTAAGTYTIGTEAGSGGGTAMGLQFTINGTAFLTADTSQNVTMPRKLTTGDNITGGNITSGYYLQAQSAGAMFFLSRSVIRSPSDGTLKLTNQAETDFTSLQLGGTTSSFPSIKRNSTALNFRLSDDSADCPITASNLTLSGTLVIPQTTPANSSVSGTAGQIWADANYVYCQTASGTIKRVALSSF